MNPAIQTLLLLLPSLLVVLLMWWRQVRRYQELRAKHNQFCSIAVGIVRMYGKEMPDGTRALLAPGDLLNKSLNTNLGIVAYVEDDEIELIGLATDFPVPPSEGTREVKPSLDANMKVALAGSAA